MCAKNTKFPPTFVKLGWRFVYVEQEEPQSFQIEHKFDVDDYDWSKRQENFSQREKKEVLCLLFFQFLLLPPLACY